jgi:ATP-dependent exoDNAse (exonuclease V) alpha subunit
MLDQNKENAIVLNQGQQTIADAFIQFLFSSDRKLKISGPGGVGKTALMGYLIDRIMPEYYRLCQMMGIEPEYDSPVVMTATTNKAAEVLGLATGRPAQTIHSFLNLKVQDDYTTGRSKITKKFSWVVHTRKIVFIDEAYMIDSELLAVLLEGTHKCKIIFIGDHCQLAPVMETVSPIHLADLPFFELTENVRNAGQPALMEVCRQLRNTVETGEFHPIALAPGVIDWADDPTMAQEIVNHFEKQTHEARILAFTNRRVTEYNDHIRGLRQLPTEYGLGELLVNVNSIELGKKLLSIEEEVEIIGQSAKTEQLSLGEFEGTPIELTVRRSTLRSGLGTVYNMVPLPVDRDHFGALLKWYAERKQWDRYFYLKKTVPDLRPRDAATVHKAQGSTYDVVFIDLADISTCHQPKTVARLLYVAFSRARNRVILYGDLSKKYGGLTLAGKEACLEPN